MKNLLSNGKKLIRQRKLRIVDGYYLFLFDKQTKTNWRYQVEYAHDTRVHDKPYVTVYAFNPYKPWEVTYWLRSFD